MADSEPVDQRPEQEGGTFLITRRPYWSWLLSKTLPP